MKIIEQKESNFKKYFGSFLAKVVDFNPNEEKIKEYFGDNFKVDYSPSTKDGEMSFLNIFVLERVINDEVEYMPLRFYISDKYHLSQEGKYKVIDKLGNTAWLTPEDFATKKVTDLTAKSGNKYNAAIDVKSMRQCHRGEEELLNFIGLICGRNNYNSTYGLKKNDDTGEYYVITDNEGKELELLIEDNFDYNKLLNYRYNSEIKKFVEEANKIGNEVSCLTYIQEDTENNRSYERIANYFGNKHSEAYVIKYVKTNTSFENMRNNENNKFNFGSLKEYDPSVFAKEVEEKAEKKGNSEELPF